VTPSVLGPGPRPSSYRSRLLVPGVAAATPVVFKRENAVLIGPDDQDTRDLAAIDPAGFRAVGPPDEGRAGALRGKPEGLLVQSQSAEALGIEAGDRVQVLVARGTERQRLARFDVVGLFERFPGFPEGVDLVANLGRYAALTRSDRADFFLVRAGEPARARAALRAGPGSAHPLDIESTETAVDRDQSSLTALNVHGLVELGAVYTLAMSAAGIAAFVFGLLLQRRREYVTLRAQGIDTWRLQALVLAEASLVAACGVVAGVLVGTGMGTLLVHVLRPLFILDPQPAVPVAEIAALAAVAGAATLACALAATAMVRRVKPTELLRET
jgi:ABC-type lipoprotein release transport system permease subunit